MSELERIWNEDTRHRWPRDVSCACTGACNELGFCAVNGRLVALTIKEARSLPREPTPEDAEAAEALKWWRAIKSKRNKVQP